MSAFTFDFDLQDDLDESFDAIPLQGSAAVPSVDKTITQERAPEKEIPAEEIPLSTLVRTLSLPFFFFLISFLPPPLLFSRLVPGRQRRSPRSPKRSRTRP